MRIKSSVKDKYNWFLSLTRDNEPRPIQQIEYSVDGLSAIECFHIFESNGKVSPCNEPELFERYIQGKVWHGITVENLSKSLVEGLITNIELKDYPTWVMNEVITQASKIAMQSIGWVPSYITRGLKVS